jgi:hypothetical protein
LLVDPQHAAVLVDFDDAGSNMLIGGGKTLVARL